ncbi:alpha/beta fold hydrolase [Brucella sp. TWI559]
MKHLFVFVIILQLAAGCANRAVTGLELTDTGHANAQSVVPFLIATVREATDEANIAYSRTRSAGLNFSEVDVRIPATHRPGRVDTSSSSPDAKRHFTAFNYKPLQDSSAFIAELNRRMANRPVAQREAFIFVHGYNNNFAEGLFRNAQIVHDYEIGSVPIHFSWASAASFTRYLYDRDSALIARKGLAQTLELVTKTKANGIVLVGHSMGAVVIMEALRTLSLEKREDVLKSIKGVMLAAPDLDPDLFRSQIEDINPLPQPFTIVVSRRDRALDISRRLAGGEPRIGSGHDIAFLQKKNVQVLDISQVDSGGHSVFASSSTLIKLLGSGHLLRRLITDEYAGMDTAFIAVGQGTLEQASLALHLPARVINRISER